MAIASHLASVGATRDVLSRHGLATKHSLGQNFLVNDAVIANICKLSEVCEEDNVLEVGPGIGTLTVALLPRAKHVLSIERDPDLPAVLDETCDDFDNFTLIGKDALRLNDDDLIVAFGKQAVEAGEAPNKFIFEFALCRGGDARARLFPANPQPAERHGYGAKRGCRPHGGRCGHERLRCVFGEAAAYRKGYGPLPGLAGQFLPAAARDELGYSS